MEKEIIPTYLRGTRLISHHMGEFSRCRSVQVNKEKKTILEKDVWFFMDITYWKKEKISFFEAEVFVRFNIYIMWSGYLLEFSFYRTNRESCDSY